MATEDCKNIPTEGSEVNTKNVSDKIATEDCKQNETTDSSQKAPKLNTTEEILQTALNDNEETVFHENADETMSSIINESVELTSANWVREKLTNIVKNVQKPPLPEGKKAYCNIPESIPLDTVESFLSKPENSMDYEKVLQRFDKTYRSYKYIGYKLDMSRRNLLMEIPDLHRSVHEIAALRNESLDELERQFLLSDHVYVKTTVPKTTSVYLWLGGIIMLEYKLDEAKTLLKNQLVLAIEKLKTIEHDLQYLREQNSICIDNWTKVYNWVLEQEVEPDIIEDPQEGVEEDYIDDTDTEDPYTEECFPDEPYTEEGYIDIETGSYPEVYAEIFSKDADADSNDFSGLVVEKCDEKSSDDTKKLTAAEAELAQRSEVVIEVADEESADEGAQTEVEKAKIESEAVAEVEKTAAKGAEAAQIETAKGDVDKNAVLLTTSCSSL